MKVIDCILFFNELDLLEIRLNYLNECVDYFVIVESEITFQGNRKEFIFEKNKSRFTKFLPKIVYYKVPYYQFDFNKLTYIENPITDDEKLVNRIYGFIDNCELFDKNQYWWGNDFYQRECISRALLSISLSDSDLVILSDADEIINIDALNHIKNMITPDDVFCCRQNEFCYFFNYFHNSHWLGSCCYLYGNFVNTSLNSIRFSSKRNETIKPKLVENAGWHFTNLGDTIAVRNKIVSWAHKEFNNKIVLKWLQYNITHGYDIFRRKGFGKLYCIKPEDPSLSPVFINNPNKYSYLFGPEIKSEGFLKKIFFTLLFKISIRISNFQHQYFYKDLS